MKTRLGSSYNNRMRSYSDYPRIDIVLSEERTISTSGRNEQAWLMIGLVLTVFVIGLYWFGERHNHQPAWTYQPVVEQQTALEQQTTVGNNDATTISPENQIISNPSPNEQLIRRFYDEVINQQQWAVMDELFAEQVTSSRSGSKSTLSLVALKEDLRAEDNYYTGLHYSIKKVIDTGDWLSVEWLAQGTTPALTNGLSVQSWSGFTAWQVVDGKLVGMWTYIDSISQNDLTATD